MTYNQDHYQNRLKSETNYSDTTAPNVLLQNYGAQKENENK